MPTQKAGHLFTGSQIYGKYLYCENYIRMLFYSQVESCCDEIVGQLLTKGLQGYSMCICLFVSVDML